MTASDCRLFYVGTYSHHSKSEGIYLGRFNPQNGHLSPVELAAEAVNPSFLALSPDGRFLYAAIETKEGAVEAFRVERSGKLTRLNQQPSGGSSPCHICVDAAGLNVLVANYNGSSISCFPIRADGSLGEASALVSFTGSGVDPVRQKKPHPHGNYADPTNRFVYSCDLGTDNIQVFQFDPSKGALRPGDPAEAKVPSGSGPRHLAFSADGKFAWVNNEMGLSVTSFERDPLTGALQSMETVGVLPEGAPRKGASTAEICRHPSGRWLYVSIRGHDSITVFAIGPEGKLVWVENVSAQVKTPRSFAIDPSGQWLLVAGQADNNITVLKIDSLSGRLTPTDQRIDVEAPVCISFAPCHP